MAGLPYALHGEVRPAHPRSAGEAAGCPRAERGGGRGAPGRPPRFPRRLRDQGYLVAGGPLLDQDDERLRGISVMSVDPATARELSSADPAVRAGRLAVQVMTWMVPAGNVRFEDVPAPCSMAEAAAD